VDANISFEWFNTVWTAFAFLRSFSSRDPNNRIEANVLVYFLRINLASCGQGWWGDFFSTGAQIAEYVVAKSRMVCAAGKT